MDGEVRAEEISACDRTQHHRPAGEQGLRPAALAEQIRLVVWRVTGRVDRLDGHAADGQFGADGQLLDVRLRLSGELATARDEVVVQVSVERVRQLDVMLVGDVEVALDVTEGIDDDPHALFLIERDEARVPQL